MNSSKNNFYLNSKLNAVLFTGLIAGTLDIAAAFLQTSIRLDKFAVEIVLRFIASGVFGSQAFSGSGLMTISGLVFHYIIAFGFTTAYFLIYPRFPFLKKNKIINGIVYGLVIWLIMNLIVVPLSMTPELKFTFDRIITGIVILMVCVGLPISIFSNKYYDNEITQ